MFHSVKIHMNLSYIINSKSYLSSLSDHLAKLVIIFSLETVILSCRTLGTGASLPALEYVLANGKK